jgi:asparagine synthase (glutamine-hydrolysing)
MFKGVFSRAGSGLDRVRIEGLEHVERGPLAIAFDQAPAVVCADVDEVTCVLNGYLYDPAGLARELGVAGGNAAELVARAYRRAGDVILTKLRGRYALALWDDRSQRGLLACDLLAMEPLFYWRGAGRFAFASELKDLFSVLPATPGPDSIAFTSWLGAAVCPPDRTLYDGVARLRPGLLIELGPEVCEPRRYWWPRYQGTMSGTRDELAEGLRAEIERSVGRRLSPRLSGVVLSGGLDSSIVTAIASRQREPGRQLRAYSAVFPGKSFDESWKVQRLTESLGIEPAAFRVEPQGALWLALTHVERWGLPLMGAGGLVEIAIMGEAAREGVEVVLDGQTGDETLGFAPYLLSDLLRHGRLIAALRLTRRWPLGRPATRRERRWVLKHVGLKGALPYRLGNAAQSLRGRDRDGGPPWLAPVLRPGFAEQQDPWAWKVGSSGPRWWRYLSDRLFEAPNRELRIDYLRHRAAAVGLVNDSPLYDFDLIDYCLRLPPELAFASEHTRPLARHAMRDVIPDEVRLNDQKADFSSFCFEVLTNADAPGIEHLLDAHDPEIRAYADMEWVRHRWLHDRPAPGRYTGRWGTVIWRIIAGECWLRAQADPGFVGDMLAREDVRAPSVHRVSLADAGTFFRLADTGRHI